MLRPERPSGRDARSFRLRPTRRRAAGRGRGAGQALVEFALAVPIFLSLLFAFVEFGFEFNAVLATNFASRDAALLAAEAGSNQGADCSVLRAVEADFGAPTDRRQLQRVEIYQATATGAQVGSPTVYVRTGTYSCRLPDGTALSLPYTRTSDGYPMSSRCDVLAGCGVDPSANPLDHVGVRITYRHTWRTAFGHALGPFLDVVKANSMRMEPIL